MTFKDFINEIFEDFLLTNQSFFNEDDFNKDYILKYFGTITRLHGYLRTLDYSNFRVIFFYLFHHDLLFVKGTYSKQGLEFLSPVMAFNFPFYTKTTYKKHHENKNGFAFLLFHK